VRSALWLKVLRISSAVETLLAMWLEVIETDVVNGRALIGIAAGCCGSPPSSCC
jgi:hypothetical protein